MNNRFEIPKSHHQSLDLIHEVLQRDLHALGRVQEESDRMAKQAEELEREINRRYQQRILVLLEVCNGPEVPDGALLTGRPDEHAVDILPPGEDH